MRTRMLLTVTALTMAFSVTPPAASAATDPTPAGTTSTAGSASLATATPPARAVARSRPVLLTRDREAGQDPMRQVAASRAARNMRGVAPSLYRGRYYAPKIGEEYRRCVLARESKAFYQAANARSSARGGYQFLDSAWRVSLTHMMMKEARANGLAKDVKALRDKPISQWNRFYQDWAFWRVYDHGAGAKHWDLPGSSCQQLR